MLDIGFIREHQDLIERAATKKRLKFDVKALMALDTERRELLAEVEGYRAEMNRASDKIPTLVGDEREAILTEMKAVKEKLALAEAKFDKVKKKFDRLMLDVPNIPDPSVPDGETDAENVEVRTWGEIKDFGFTPKGHIELLEHNGWVDFARGAKVAGFRGNFRMGGAAMLEFAVWQYALELLQSKGFTPVLVPALAKPEFFMGTGWFPQAEEDVYKTQDELYLAGTAEVPLMGFHSGETIAQSELPKKYVGFSPCYRREAGSHGKDTRGLYRLHEFYKVEQVILCEGSHQLSVALHEEIVATAEELMQGLEIPYHVVTNCGGDLGLGQVKKYDVEGWLPSEGRYRETHSASYFHDFQARRLNIRYKDESGETKFVHSLNSTVAATPRLLEMILENHQQEDGSIRVPKVLQKWIGKDVLSR